MSQQQTVMIMAGGTGGHVFPALAIAEALRAQQLTVHWLGTEKGLEARVVPQANITIHYIKISGLRGKGRLQLLLAPFKIIKAIWQAIKVLRQVRPTVVIGLGGFVTGPGGIAAWLLRIPLIIHEQNAVMGLTNRWLARIATQVLEAFPNTFPPRYHAVHTGNPLRANIMAVTRSDSQIESLHILVFGGSLGAKALNEIVPAALLKIKKPITVIHQAGELHITAMQQAYAQAKFKTQVVAFIDDMAAAYQWADLVICRAGALTVSELAQVSVASILIPFPHAVDDHQTHNARFLSDENAAVLLPQSELTIEKLSLIINELLDNPTRLATMAMAAKNKAKPLALQQIVTAILSV